MASNSETITLSVGSDKTTMMVDRPAAADRPQMKSVLMLAHGAGAGIDHEFFQTLVPLITAYKVAVVRYNFLYMDKRSKRPDRKDVCFKVIASAIDYCRSEFPDLPLYAGGKSFGGRMTSLYLSGAPTTDVKGIVFLGFPLHPPKEPGTERAEHLKKLRIPCLFLQGTRDTLAEMSLIKEVVAGLPRARMEIFEGADHSFEVLKRSGIKQSDVFVKLAQSIATFCEQ